MRRTWLAPMLGLGALTLTGCSLFAGGSGHFEVEGATYEASSISCKKVSDGLALILESGAAVAKVGITDEPEPKVVGVTMGAQSQTSMLMRAADQIGYAVVTRHNKTFVVSGHLEHVSQGQPQGGKEDFNLTVTCNSIS